jgi:hypothetical protein
MLNEETYGNLDEIVSAAAMSGIKPGALFIAPWRLGANQDHLHEGLEQCGCAFCPDEPNDSGRPLP